jgi:signal peptidase I
MNGLTRWLKRSWREYRAVVLFAVLLFGFRSAWADWVDVPSGSMNPTILEGDRVLVDKHVYGLRLPWTLIRLSAGRDPARGEIVVFDSPRNGVSLVKRLVAVPGDTVALENERLIVNGVPAEYAAGNEAEIASLLSGTRALGPRVFREARALPEHDILLLPGRPALRSIGPLTVPAGMYFVLGDNRDDSADSRYIGFVPRRNFVGHATRVVVSLDPERHYLPRTSRSLQPLG